MPEEDFWNTFFDVECVIEKMFGENACQGNLVEFGSGYGTFTIQAAKQTKGCVSALDIDAELIAQLEQKLTVCAIQNVRAEVCDFVANGSGLERETQAHAMIYNLLHLEHPLGLLKEAYRVLQPGGKLSVIHWRRDISTPRGPAMLIRPSPAQCREWIAAAGFHSVQDIELSECCQFHYGIVAVR